METILKTSGYFTQIDCKSILNSR